MIEAKYPSKERVIRGPYLVYAVGDEIPESDVDELRRQGYLREVARSDDDASGPPAKKAPARRARKPKS